MTCLIIDDNPLARLALRNLVEEISFLQITGECKSAMEVYNVLQKGKVDLLLLDVEMPGMSGLDLLRSLDQQPMVILITSKADYAVEGFDLQVVDYIVKPVELPRLIKAVQRAKERMEQVSGGNEEASFSDHLFLRINNQLQRIDFDEILFVQALGDYVVFQTEKKKYPVHLTMKAVEERLPEERFMRVHRSYLIALDKIVNIEQNSLQIGNHLVPVSEKIKGELMHRLNVL